VQTDAISYAVRRLYERGGGAKHVMVRSDFVPELLHTARLARPAEQVDNVVLFLGRYLDERGDPAARVDIPELELASVAGCRADGNGVVYLRKHVQALGWITTDAGLSVYRYQLTLSGWDRYERLIRAEVNSRRAFMAMQFNNPNLDHAYENCFKPAVADTGFILSRLSEGQGAGLIDDQLRVAIRASKFLIADLSTANRGAYWEAGFAEGLG